MTTRPLWAKEGVELDDDIVRYCAGDDWLLDKELLGFDLLGSIAHVKGLVAISALETSDGERLLSALEALFEEHKRGTFSPTPDDEDGHSAIERALVERLGESGKRVHLGRSRNDQVLTATRLWMREKLAHASRLCIESARVALQRAEETQHLLLPGYTHLQRAVPSTAGFWFAGHAESLLEDAEAIARACALLDASPLGTAAGYGVNLPLDRDLAAKELGFSRLVVNGMCAQNGRGRLEAHALSALLCAMGTVRRLAWDLSLFSMAELSFVRLPDRFTTGSSIMPNKRNPDVVEIMRAALADVAGAHVEVWSTLSLPSGYQRDLQRTKGAVMRGVKASLATLSLLPALLSEMAFDEERAASALDDGMLATDRAVELAAEGMPFRDAYRQVARELAEAEGGRSREELVEAARASVRARRSPGAPGALQIDRIAARADEVERMLG